MRTLISGQTRALHPLWLALALGGVAGCSSESPFSHVQVSGTIAYEDGTLIPAEQIILKFEPLAERLNSRTYPPAGMSYVNVADGTFDVVTSHKYADGLVQGKHRVLVWATTASGEASELVPTEYTESARTPLVVDTAETPFEILVRKP